MLVIFVDFFFLVVNEWAGFFIEVMIFCVSQLLMFDFIW